MPVETKVRRIPAYLRSFISDPLAAVLHSVGSITLSSSEINASTLNIRSILHRLHFAALSDLIVSHHPDLFCLTETWIKKTQLPALNLKNVLHLITLS